MTLFRVRPLDGRPEVLTAWLDPSVTAENDPLSADPDPFSPANGPPYSTEFQRRYRAAQRARVYASDARTLYDAIAAPDKTLEFIKADHYLQEPDAARAQAADLITAWVTSHAGRK